MVKTFDSEPRWIGLPAGAEVDRDTNDLAPDKMLKINIWICCDKGGRTDAKSICDSVKRIARSDSIATRIFCAAVHGNVNIRSRLQTS